MDNVTNHTLCVGGDFVHPHLYTPSCSCGWSGDPVVSERTAWDVAAAHARISGQVEDVLHRGLIELGWFGSVIKPGEPERECEACAGTGTDHGVPSGPPCTYCHGQGRI